MTPTKACPVVVRARAASGTRELLVFDHPQAGTQLAKGTIEPGEASGAAALRELAEESGIDDASLVRSLGLWDAAFEGQVWAFWLVAPRLSLADTWTREVEEDGTYVFAFRWHPLDAPADERWHPVHARALAFVRAALSR